MQRARRVRVHRVERVDRLFLLDARRRGELGDRRRAAELGRELVEHPGEAEAELLEASWHVHRPRLVAEVTANLADDRRHRVAREVDAAVDVEPVDGLDEADRPDLDEILERLAAARVPQGERADERHELDERPVAGFGSPSRWKATSSASTSVSMTRGSSPWVRRLRVRARGARASRPGSQRLVARGVDVEPLAQERDVEEPAQLGSRAHDRERASERADAARAAMQHRQQVGARVRAFAEIDDDVDVAGADRAAREAARDPSSTSRFTSTTTTAARAIPLSGG